MKKFTLLTFRRHRDELLRQLQRFGELHLKKLSKDELAGLDFLLADFSPEQSSELESSLEQVRFAMAKIGPYREKPKGLSGLTAQPPKLGFDELDSFLGRVGVRGICAEAREFDEQIGAAKAEAARLLAENENLKAWIKLDAAPASFGGLESARAVLGTVSALTAESFRQSLESAFGTVYVELLGVTKGDMAVFALLPADGFEDIYARMKDEGFSRSTLVFSEVPADRIAANNRRIAELDELQREAADGIAGLAPELGNLQIAHDCLKTRLEREMACENFLRTDSALMMEGWIPAEEEGRLLAILESVCGNEFYSELEEVDKDSPEIPVKLKNNKIVSAFEDVTVMYATPRYNEIDPTPLFTPFYWVFFGFMLGDTGYGLVLCLGTALALRFFALKDGMRRFLQFFHYLSYSVMLAGLVYGSMFGFTYFAPIPVYDSSGVLTGQKAILDSMTDIPTMLILAVALGVIQVIFGLCIKGYLLVRDGHPLDALFDAVFWIVTLLGGIGYLVGATGVISGTLAAVCKWCFWGGLIGLVLTQGREGKTIAGKIGFTLWNVYGISGYVGDLISYTRIVALGLSGAFIAFSFIQMASILPAGILRWTVGFVIVFLGQTLDIGLGLLGAYVHTCRLQYVEYFGKFYEGGGVGFKPFTFKNDYIQIEK